jgi:type IV secretory pathway VirB2 component (pilin)
MTTQPQTLAALRPAVPSIESVLARRWARVLIPSLSDLFFLAILVWLFMSTGATGWQGLLVDADCGWHIRTGEYILNHHAVPRHDLYSFSKAGEPWYAWEWLSDVIFAWLHQLAGLKGIVLAAGVLIAAFATTLIRRMVWRDVHLFVAMAVALPAVGASSIHFLARPHIFTLLLLSVSVWMIEADRKHPSRRIWWLVPLTAVWTNLHGGFLVLIAVLGIAALGTAIEAWMERSDFRSAIRYAALTAACAAASLINPYGYQLHLHVVEYLRSDWIRNAIQEFQSPTFRSESMLQFEALLLIGLIAAGFLFRRRRVVEGLWIVFFAHMSLASVRHVPVYVTVAAPLIAREIAQWWNAWTASVRKGSIAGILNQMAADSIAGFRRSSIWALIVVFALVLIGPPIPWPKDFPAALFPTEIVHRHAAEILNSRVLTTDQWADYLIYTNPQQRVFVDGRSDFYGPEIGNQYLHLTEAQWDWEQWMAKYNFNLVLLPIESSLPALLKRDPDWRVVEDDGKRILLARRSTPVPATGNSRQEPRF